MYCLKKWIQLSVIFTGPFLSLFSSDSHYQTNSPLCTFEHIQTIEDHHHRLEQICELYWNFNLEINSDMGFFYGVPGTYETWPRIDSDILEKDQAFSHSLLNAVNEINSEQLTDEETITLAILKRELNGRIDGGNFGEHYLILDQIGGIHLDIARILEMMPTKTFDDYQAIIRRLKALPEFLNQVKNILKEGLEKGITPPNISIQSVPNQILKQISTVDESNPFLSSLYRFPACFDSDDQDYFVTRILECYLEKVMPAIHNFYTFVVNDYIPNCRQETAFSSLPQGKEWYSSKVKTTTTTNLSPEEIHAIGIKEVKRVEKEIHKLLKKVSFHGSLTEFYEYMKNNSKFFYTNSEDILKGYKKILKHIEFNLPKLFHYQPSLPCEIISIPSYAAEGQSMAFYLTGSIALNRPGYFFVNTSHPNLRPKWEMEVLTLHEALPGHHLQLTYAQEIKDLPTFRKFCNFVAYIEGWGLYSESLGKELGLYKTHHNFYGRLSYEMMRAVRLVVDTGMHTMGWSRQEAIDYFARYIGKPKSEIETEIDRYLVYPAQALAYKIGEIKIQELRSLAEKELQDDFDIRDFHQEWLKHGSIPLDCAEASILKWIKEQKLYYEELREHHLPTIS